MSKANSTPLSDDQLSKRVLACQIFAWTLLSLVSTAAIYTWAHNLDWQFAHLSSYQFFPVLGLLAFSIMWSHYVSGFVRLQLKLPVRTLQRYFSATSYVVLGLIFLHPGILIYQRFRDGYGLPPNSYISYVRPGLGWVTLLGSVSLMIFVAFEFRRRYGKRSWWKYVLMANDAAMLAIFYHGLRLGTNLMHGWFRGLWFVYGASLLIIIVSKFLTVYYPTRPAAETSEK